MSRVAPTAVRVFRDRSAAVGRALLACSCAFAAACSGDLPAATDDVTTLARLVVTLNRDALLPTEAAQGRAEGRDAGGRPVEVTPPLWSSTDESVATVSRTGLVTAKGVGTARIVAAVDGIRGEAPIRVSAVPVNVVTVTPLKSVIAPGERTRLSAHTRDAAGRPLAGRAVAWLSSDTTRAQVDNDGTVAARSSGVVLIAAISEDVFGIAEVRVSGPPGPVASVTPVPAAIGLVLGDSRALAAVLEDADGNQATGRAVAWTSLAPAVATVSPAGVVTGVSRGSARIRATSEGVWGDAEVTVTDIADSIHVAFAEPAKDDIVGDTLRIFANVTTRNTIVRVHARLTSSEVLERDLVDTPVGVMGTRFAWAGVLDVTWLRYGAYQVILTAYDNLGNAAVFAHPFQRGAREGKGGTTLPPRNR